MPPLLLLQQPLRLQVLLLQPLLLVVQARATNPNTPPRPVTCSPSSHPSDASKTVALRGEAGVGGGRHLSP